MPKSTTDNPAAAWTGLGVSVALLLLFFALQAWFSNVLQLPFQFLIVALVPTVVGLLMSGFNASLKAPGIEAEFHRPDPKLDKLPENPPLSKGPDDQAPVRAGALSITDESKTDLKDAGKREYERTGHYMLAHEYRPSKVRGQKYEVDIFVVRHERGVPGPPRRQLQEIEQAEFYFGDAWGEKPILVNPTDDSLIGLRTFAWGTFFAACRIRFRDQKSVILYRFIDFSMAPGYAY